METKQSNQYVPASPKTSSMYVPSDHNSSAAKSKVREALKPIRETLLTRSTLTARQKQLEKLIKNAEKKISSFPPGELFCYRNGKYSLWYNVVNHHRTFISKKDHIFAEQLAQKKLLTAQVKDWQEEYQLITSHLKTIPTLKYYNSYVESILSNPLYFTLLKSSYTPVIEELAKWSKESYEKNPTYPEQLIHDGISGQKLRSKSEVYIDRILFLNNIPYRYECLMDFGDKKVYPDFLIRHPKSGEFFIWEHFGMMDNQQYALKTFQKMEMYYSHGYVPSVNFIATFETQKHPLTISNVENLVKQYFLT